MRLRKNIFGAGLKGIQKRITTKSRYPLSVRLGVFSQVDGLIERMDEGSLSAVYEVFSDWTIYRPSHFYCQICVGFTLPERRFGQLTAIFSCIVHEIGKLWTID